MELTSFADGDLNGYPIHDQDFIYKAFDLVSEGIFIIEANKGVVFSNSAAREMLHVELGSEIEKLFNRFPLLDREGIKKIGVKERPSYRVLHGERLHNERYVLHLPDGGRKNISVNATPIHKDGTAAAIVSIFDISAEVEYERRISEERIRSIHADKMAALGTLSVEIAHQIQNPVSVAQGACAVLRKMIADQEPVDNLTTRIDVVDGALNRISNIIRSLRNLSRDSSHDTASRYHLMDVLRDVYELVNTRLKFKGIAFDVDLEDSLLERTVICPRIQVSEALMNLFINAIDSIEDTEGAWIKLEVDENESSYIFRVMDSGPGVEENLREKIFEPFFTTKKIGKGTGLGLPIARTLMRSFNGDVKYVPECGVSCFEVHLPKLKMQ